MVPHRHILRSDPLKSCCIVVVVHHNNFLEEACQDILRAFNFHYKQPCFWVMKIFLKCHNSFKGPLKKWEWQILCLDMLVFTFHSLSPSFPGMRWSKECCDRGRHVSGTCSPVPHCQDGQVCPYQCTALGLLIPEQILSKNRLINTIPAVLFS